MEINVFFTESEVGAMKNVMEEIGIQKTNDFLRYTAILYLAQFMKNPSNELVRYSQYEMKNMMAETIKEKERGEKFIISTLLPPKVWFALENTTKKSLTDFVKENALSTKNYRIKQALPNKSLQFEKIK